MTQPVKPIVTFLIVAYNSADDIEACLRSISQHVEQPHQVVVVDNASSDDTVAVLRSNHPVVDVLANAENVGFAAAVNQAARVAKGDFLVLLNPDAELGAGCVSALLDAEARKPDGGLYGGRCVRTDGSLEPSSCWGAPSVWSAFCFGTGLSAAFRDHRLLDPESLGGWQRDSEREVGVVTGCLLLVRRSLWETLRGFDEDYWLYGEDVDITVRARRAGYKPMITPAATVIHHIGASSDNDGWRLSRILQGRITFQRKLNPGIRGRFGVAMVVVGVAVRALPFLERFPGRKQGTSVWAYAWRERDGWRHGYQPRTDLPPAGR